MASPFSRSVGLHKHNKCVVVDLYDALDRQGVFRGLRQRFVVSKSLREDPQNPDSEPQSLDLETAIKFASKGSMWQVPFCGRWVFTNTLEKLAIVALFDRRDLEEHSGVFATNS